MQMVSAVSTLETVPAMAQDIEGQLKAVLPRSPDLLLVFVSYAMANSFSQVVSMLQQAMVPGHMVAVVGESVIGGEQELERTVALSALALVAPGVGLHSFHMEEDQWQALLTDDEFLAETICPAASGDAEEAALRAFVMFGDPFTTPVVQLLDACSRRFPGVPVIGGMASGMQHAGDTRLALNGEIHTTGMVGISIAGEIEINCVVSQGCRPIGEGFTVTKCRQNLIEELNGKPALAAIEEMIGGLSEHDRGLVAEGGLQIGRVIDEGKGNQGRGDFLIRALVGVKRETGAILIGDYIRPGQTLQFHVRDAKTADEEMRLLLEGETMLASATPPAGALLVTCNGRGQRLFNVPHHDVGLVRQVMGAMPIAGFFAAGELGPVGDRNFIHGHTAVLAVFRAAGAGAGS